MHILFIDDDDDDSTNIDDVHLSNVESNIVVGDNRGGSDMGSVGAVVQLEPS